MIVRSTIARILAHVHHDDEDGQGLAEYALILALIAVIAIVGLIFLGGQISDKLSTIGSQLKSVSG
jgi:pilus assembly protein Flp/PilA